MRFSKKGDIYKVIRITGSQDNILGISFGKGDLEVIELDYGKTEVTGIQSSKEEVLKQVLSGLEWVNQALGTNYKISKIYFYPYDIPANSVYKLLICKLIRHYHNGEEFIEN